jgi:diguanylate cyclase (GGDEF)-like protein
MGTLAAVVIVAVATISLALIAWLFARAARRSGEGTEGAIREVATTLGWISDDLARVVERAAVGPEPVSFPITLDLEEALGKVAAVAAALPGMTAGAARLDQVDGTTLTRTVGISAGVSGLESYPDPPDRLPWRRTIVEWSHDVGEAGPEPVRLAVVAPVAHAGRRIGLVAAYTSAAAVNEEVAESVVALAASAAPALHAAREHQAVSELVRTDPLTGLLNRRGGVEEALPREIARARRSGAPLSILMLDLDNFREVNRVNYAHGDDVLQEFARVVREACRESDIPCRRGGEEFLLILPDTECLDALRLERRLRALVSATDFSHIGAVTYSAGVTALHPDDPTDGRSIDERASELVNDAKRAGKDTIRHDCEEMPPVRHQPEPAEPRTPPSGEPEPPSGWRRVLHKGPRSDA